MQLAKKLVFSLPFVISFIGYCIFLHQFLENPNLLFGIDIQTILLSAWVVITAILTGFFFSLFITISQDKKIVLCPIPAILLSSFLLLPESSRLIITISLCFLFLFIFLSLRHTLNTYISFTPQTLLLSHIKHVATFLFILGSLAFYLSFQQQIQKQGFLLPQPIFDAILKTVPQAQFLNLTGEQSDSPKNIKQIKNNPELLKQFGLTEDMLNPKQLTQSQLQQQTTNLLKPYESFLPIIFSALFFFSLHSLASIFSIFLGPLISLVFWILDKTKFTTYTTEARQVRKLVV